MTMEFGNQRVARKREIRTRAPTACQTCRLRKTRCDNTRPICSYCAVQGVECNYPETSPQQNQLGFDPVNPSNQEVLQRLNHIAGLLEDIKTSEGSTSSSRSLSSLKEGFFELAVRNTSPVADSLSGTNPASSSTASIDDRGTDHDPRILYMASSGENMLRWPIFNKVITEAEKHIRSFLLDSLDSQPRSIQAPRQVGIGSFVDEIPRLCRKYFLLCHRRNPIVDLENLDRYAKEVTVQGLGWDGPSCQVLLACALASCTSSKFVPLAEDMPANLDGLQAPPMSDANLDLAETYFHAAKQRFGFLHTSPTDIQCFLLAGSYHRHAIRPLQAWFCYQQASCRLEVRLRSLCRERWTADDNYHNLESRLYWSCIQAEHEMQSELPLWNSGLESMGYSDPFPKFPSRNSSSSYDHMDEDQDFSIRPGFELNGTEEERGWKFYIGSICNRRTTNEIVSDMWRQGEKGWTKDIPHLLRKTLSAENVVTSWYQISIAGIQSTQDNPDLRFFFRGRYHMALERIYRPAFYLAMHYKGMPTFIKNNHQVWVEVFDLAQKAVDNCVILIPSYWYQFRHEWIWNVVRASFACAVHILGAVLYQVEASRDSSTWQVRIPPNWAPLVRLSIRTLRHWSAESTDLELMGSILERMYQGTCRLANNFFLTSHPFRPSTFPPIQVSNS
ncbi:Kae1-associated kinase Bud32 [Penicillium fimorum]|uniref:Kae1-associated kinase Bud32 n=1 Tax=Penicillium fimorum TaxID=1882269 RepID=A0A9X0CAK0_9EURO|nr:Kae1-associated kinase Bud32 [Penicillium fimorum]